MTVRKDVGRASLSIRPRGIPLLAFLALLATTAAPGQNLPEADRPMPAPMAPPGVQARLLVRTGDRAPVPGRFGFAYGMALLPGGGLVVESGYGESLVLRDETTPGRILLHVGDRVPDCGTVTEILQVATGADGSIAARITCTGGEAIVRVDPAGGVIETAFRSGMTVAGLPVGYVWGPAIDGQGRIVVAADGGLDASALLRQAPGGTPEILIRSGDAIGGGTLRQTFWWPQVNSGGKVAFHAILSGGLEVIATLVPGAPPVVVDSASVLVDAGGFPRPLLGFPTINDAGAVAFLHADSLDASGYATENRLMRATGGPAETIVAAGDPAPGGATFSAIWGSPVIEATGSVVFGATTTSAGEQLYRFDGVSTAIMGSVTEDGEPFSSAGGGLLVAPDGSVFFNGYLYDGSFFVQGSAVLAARNGQVRVVIRPGELLGEPARFVTLGSAPYPQHYLSAGPFMAPGGGILFDAAVSGGSSGLFARAVDGTLSAAVLAGDAAPGGGHFMERSFAFHSYAADGRMAFLAIRQDVPDGGEVELFTGPAGGPFVTAARPGQVVAGLAAPIASIGPPSRIDASGAIAVPVGLSDGTTALLFWDGAALTRFVASGDTLPDGEAIAVVRTGEDQAPLPPLLEDSGNLYFGVVTAGGTRALYRATLSLGLDSATRVLGDGDVVEGGVLQPLLLRALTSDASGRVAFQAVPSPGPAAATYVLGAGGTSVRVAGPGDALGSVEVTAALPRLAATAAGIVHETSNRFLGTGDVLWFATPRTSTGSGTSFDHAPLNQGGMPSPDGGAYPYRIGIGFGPGSSPFVRTARIGSDGDRFAVSIERTTMGPDDLILWDLRPEGDAPVAMAGPDQTIECTGPAGATIALDGRGSSDPESGPLEYTWTSPFTTVKGPTATMTVPLGSWPIYLSVRNAAGLVSTDRLDVAVRDTVPPTITAQAVPASLWPAKGQMTPIEVSVNVQDLCTPKPLVWLTSIASSDPKASLEQDVSGAAIGSDDRSFALRARRAGRAWTVTYTAMDFGGNRTPLQLTIPIARPRGR